MNKKRVWLPGVVIAVGALVAICGVNLASADKPGGATPTSKIFYSQHSPAITYDMYQNGANKMPVDLPPGVEVFPSSQVYGGSRWLVTTDIDPDSGFSELFAYDEDGNPPVQLTVAGPDFVFGLESNAVPRWSNDGQDSFVTFDAATAGGGYLCRLWITDDDIAAIQSGAPPFTAADIELVLPHPVGYADYTWSNNDWVLAYLTINYDASGSRTIWVRTLTNSVPIYARASAEGTIATTGPRNFIQWSPDGSRIAFTTYNASGYGGVWTIKPDGTQPVKVKSNSGTMSYSSRGWSPDSKELLMSTIKDRGFGTWYYNLARMPAGGGTLTTLTSDLEQTTDKTAVGWVPLGL